MNKDGSVRQVGVALTVEDFEGAAALYGEALGLPVAKEWDEPHGKGVILAAGVATIEIVDRAQAEFIDKVEVGSGRTAGTCLGWQSACVVERLTQVPLQGLGLLAPDVHPDLVHRSDGKRPDVGGLSAGAVRLEAVPGEGAK